MIVREEAFNAQRKVEKFGIEDVERTYEIWKKNGGEIIALPPAEQAAYLEQVQSVVPNLMKASPTLKEDDDLLTAAAARSK